MIKLLYKTGLWTTNQLHFISLQHKPLANLYS